MLPSDLTADHFSHYPPEARALATARIGLLKQLPTAFLGLLLRELITYDWKFPAERRDLDNQFGYLNSLSAEQLRREMEPFAQLRLSSELERSDWVNAPVSFSEKLSAHLWATHQLDAFRKASIDYVHKMNAATSAQAQTAPVARLGMVAIGEGVTENRYRLFRKLRPQGVYFKNVRPENGLAILQDAVAVRAKTHPIPFGHWYIDGADTASVAPGLTCVSYKKLEVVRLALVSKMRKVMQAGAGPEALRSMLAEMRPEEFGLSGSGDQAVLHRFELSVLAEGSGTQLFSTTFVQWSAREALRRAQPVTLLARFAPRQREQSMRELLAGTQQQPTLDPAGSLIDADMGAFYTWINQQRLAGAERAGFLVWFEGHNEALAVGPGLERGKEDASATTVAELLRKVS